MEQVKIVFFILTSFFGVEEGHIAADTTTVTIDPKTQEIEIIQDNLFTVIQSEKDSSLIRQHWDKLQNKKERKTAWAKELDNFTDKNLTFTPVENTVQPHLTLTYSKEKDLQTLGIWYNSEKDQFSINHIPQQNIKTNDGKLVGNYWIFDGDGTFSFTMEPFLEMPEKYKKSKIAIQEILRDNNTAD